MKNYCKNSIDFHSHDAGLIQQKMNELKSEGWKKLSFSTYTTEMEDGCWIEGYRPFTKREMLQIKKEERLKIKSELKTLERLAKKHGFKLTREV